MRKYSIRSLMEMIAYLDNVHNDKYFIMSATLMIQGLIKYLSVVETKVLIITFLIIFFYSKNSNLNLKRRS